MTLWGKKLMTVLLCAAMGPLFMLGGCANSQSDDGAGASDASTVSLVIDSETARFLTNRAAMTRGRAANESLYLDVALKGDYTESKTETLSLDATDTTVSFDAVPVGKTIWVEARAYLEDETEICSGKSDETTVRASGNNISVTMSIAPIYVAASGNANNDGSRESPLGSISQAVDGLSLLNYKGRYTIKIIGSLTTAQTISSSLTTAKAASLTIMGDSSESKLDGNGNASGSMLTITTQVPIIIKDLKIKGGTGYSGCGIKITNGGNVTIGSNASVSNNIATPGVCQGAGVYVSNGSLILDGGSISNNQNGSGVYLNGDNSTFTMKAGEISNNENEGPGGQGGGVYLDRGTFTMEGGSITNNSCSYGGGVYTTDHGKFIMKGGTISGNQAINNGNGLFISSDTTGFTISGSAYFSTDDWVYLDNDGGDNKVITIAGKLTNTQVATLSASWMHTYYGQLILILAEGANTTLADECSKFTLTGGGVTKSILADGKVSN